MLKSIYYELKYQAEKRRAKKQYYRDVNAKADMQDIIDDKNNTIAHQKEVIKSLREQITNNKKKEVE